MVKTAKSGSCAHAPAKCAVFTSLCKKEKEVNALTFLQKTNMKGTTESSLGPFSCVLCNAASLLSR